jgi:hypothetical protein
MLQLPSHTKPLAGLDWGTIGAMPSYQRISVDPRQMGGTPCIRRLRIPVATVVEMVTISQRPCATQPRLLENVNFRFAPSPDAF